MKEQCMDKDRNKEQESGQSRRAAILDAMARNDQESGMLELTYKDMEPRKQHSACQVG
jgi:hypothetical protein